jgi:hypothetical protein
MAVMRRTSIALALTLLLGTSVWVGAASVDDTVSEARLRLEQRAPAAVADRLYCGMSVPSGGVVTDAQVEAFLTEVVEPRFPDGFTVWRARGAWMGGREETTVIEIAHPGDAESLRRVEEIGAAYARRFGQSAVLRLTVPAHMKFISG